MLLGQILTVNTALTSLDLSCEEEEKTKEKEEREKEE